MRRLILIGLALSPLVNAASAETAQSIGPFEGMSRANLVVTLGGALDAEGGTALRLFQGDHERAAQFRSSLIESVSVLLARCEIVMNGEVKDELAIRIFGRPELAAHCPNHYIYLIEIEVYNHRQASTPASDIYYSLRPVIGLATEATLEEELTDRTLTILSDELGRCAQASSR